MSAPAETSRTRAWWTLAALAIPLFALSVDLNGVAILLPDVAADLDTSPLRASAVVTAAALGFAAPLLLVGRASDRLGARTFLLGGVAAFALGSAICALSDSLVVLVLGRAVQGVASAGCFTTSLVIVDATFTPARRPVAIGVWAAIGGLGGAVGPLVASGLASAWSWRAFFAVNVGLGAVALVALALLVPVVPGDPARRVRPARLGVLAAGVATGMGALQHAGSAGWDAPAVGLLVAGGALVAAALRAGGDEPLVAGAVTGASGFASGSVAAAASNWGSGVALVLLPSALAAARGIDLLATGALFLAFSAPFAAGGAVSGPLVRVIGGRRATAGALVVQAGGLAALAGVGLDGPLIGVLAALAVSGLGNGVAYSTATTVALAAVDAGRQGEASGLLTMTRLLGLTVGVAASAMLLRALADAPHLARSDGVTGVLVLGAAVTATGAVVLGTRRPAGARR